MKDLSYKVRVMAYTTLALAGEMGKYASLLYGIAHVVGDKPDIPQIVGAGVIYVASSALSTSFGHTFELARINQEQASELAKLSVDHSAGMTKLSVEHSTRLAAMVTKRIDDLEKKLGLSSPVNRH